MVVPICSPTAGSCTSSEKLAVLSLAFLGRREGVGAEVDIFEIGFQVQNEVVHFGDVVAELVVQLLIPCER